MIQVKKTTKILTLCSAMTTTCVVAFQIYPSQSDQLFEGVFEAKACGSELEINQLIVCSDAGERRVPLHAQLPPAETVTISNYLDVSPVIVLDVISNDYRAEPVDKIVLPLRPMDSVEFDAPGKYLLSIHFPPQLANGNKSEWINPGEGYVEGKTIRYSEPVVLAGTYNQLAIKINGEQGSFDVVLSTN